jgi:hypothetical protein
VVPRFALHYQRMGYVPSAVEDVRPLSAVFTDRVDCSAYFRLGGPVMGWVDCLDIWTGRLNASSDRDIDL